MRTQDLRSILLRTGVPASVEIFLNPQWGSQEPSHRQSLRAAIQANVAGGAAILDLTRLAKSASHTISISHCKGLGGFAIAPPRFSLGLDIEYSARVGRSDISRVAFDPVEIAESPTPSVFWAAKEAAFKSMEGHYQPRGLKDLRIGSWSQIERGVFRCDVLETDHCEFIEISGVVTEDGVFTYAVFWGETLLRAAPAGEQLIEGGRAK
jgi:hypothetical protein